MQILVFPEEVRTCVCGAGLDDERYHLCHKCRARARWDRHRRGANRRRRRAEHRSSRGRA